MLAGSRCQSSVYTIPFKSRVVEFYAWSSDSTPSRRRVVSGAVDWATLLEARLPQHSQSLTTLMLDHASVGDMMLGAISFPSISLTFLCFT